MTQFYLHLIYSVFLVAATLAGEHYGYPIVRKFVLRVFNKTQSAAKAEADALRAKAHAVEMEAGIIPPPPVAPIK
jgi:hypothetical protein